jgi:hypothetical protein
VLQVLQEVDARCPVSRGEELDNARNNFNLKRSDMLTAMHSSYLVLLGAEKLADLKQWLQNGLS